MSQPPRPIRTLVRLAAATALAAGTLGAAQGASAATMTFGSSLSAPATLETATDLGYAGYGIPTIMHEQSIVFHIYHDGADTALWNASLASGTPTAPANGQVTSVSLEGCAQPAPGGPAPLTQIHFQDLVPQAGGGVLANVTTQPFAIPVCGVGGASGSTVTAYQPTNFCVHQGDYVDFNDEGGWNPEVPLAYPDGVPYEVIGAVGGSTMDSYIANDGVGNGAVFSPSVVTDHNGFAANAHEELLLQATLATGPDATPLCPGGTHGAASPGGAAHGPAVTVPHQDDGVNRRGLVAIALYCHAATTCTGSLTLHAHGAHAAAVGGAPFSVSSLQTGKVTVHLAAGVQRALRRLAGELPVAVTVVPAGGRPWTESIGLRGWR
jgi:hypothetical protein